MSKTRLKVSLTHNNKKIISDSYNGVLIDKIIKYKDEQTSNILDLEKNILKRINKDYQITLNFNEQKGIYNYQNMEIPIELKIIKTINTENRYYIKYELIMSNENIGTFIYNINYEVNI